MIKREGFEVDLAEDGVEAVSMIRNSEYDLVFMDCEMPRMDGWEATKTIREADLRQPPIVAATAYVTPADRQRCQDAGMDGFLAKPLSAELVQGVLLRWVAHESVHLPPGSVFELSSARSDAVPSPALTDAADEAGEPAPTPPPCS